MVPTASTFASRPDFCASGSGTIVSGSDFCASDSCTTDCGQGTPGQPSSSSPRLCSCDWSTTLIARADASSVDAVWLIRTTMPHTTNSEMQIGINQLYHLVLSPAAALVRPLSERR